MFLVLPMAISFYKFKHMTNKSQEIVTHERKILSMELENVVVTETGNNLFHFNLFHWCS